MGASSLLRLPTPLLGLLCIVTLSQAQQCYIAAYGLVGDVGWTACPGTASSSGGVESCCLSANDCGEDSICRDSSSSGTNWYLAGCTDPSFNDPLCRDTCVSYSTTFIEWLDGSKEWMCCGNGGCNGTVTDDTFSAVSPADWQAVTGAETSQPTTKAATSNPSSTTPTTNTPTTALSSPLSTPSSVSPTAPLSSTFVVSSSSMQTSKPSRTGEGPTSTDFKPEGVNKHTSLASAASSTDGGTGATAVSTAGDSGSKSSQGLSTGAKAGIGIAVAVAVVAVIVAVVAVVMLRRKRKSEDTVFEKRVEDRNSANSSVPPPYHQAVEIDETEPTRELPDSNAIYEIDSVALRSKAYGGMG